MGNFLANTPLGTALKTFVAVLLSGVVASWATDGAISFDKWQTWVIAACVSALPVIVNYLNPADGRYGNGSPDAH
jgi:hypothetical protein